MRRIALVLLMVLLPLQSIWAAAANATQHERGGGVKPFGHHEHAHAGVAIVADDASADTADTAGEPGSTCSNEASTCHGHAPSAAFAEEGLAVAVCRAGYVHCPYERFIADRFLDSPLRPPVLQLA